MKKVISPLFFIFFLIFVAFLLEEKSLLPEINFLHFDAEHYLNIKKTGYFGVNIAFFPLFPLVWRFLQVEVWGICAVNAAMFGISLALLAHNFQFSRKTLWLCLSLPSAVFFYLPYSESIFFFCSVLLLIGLKRDNMFLLFVALFLATLSRPAFTIFVPAIMLVYGYEAGLKRLFFYKTGISLLAIFLGMSLVSMIQFLDTGAWFEFFSVQSKWGNHLQFPSLPLRGWGGDYAVRLEAIALFSGLVFAVYLSYLLLKKIKGEGARSVATPIVFALSYLAGMTLLVLCFRGGSLFSLNRFIFPTAFFMLMIHYYMESKVDIKKSQILKIALASLLFWLLFASYVHIQSFLQYSFISLYMVLFLFLGSKNEWLQTLVFFCIIVINLFFQGALFVRFLENGWIG